MDTLSQSDRGERMGRVRSTNTKPEMLVRRLVFSMGYRYRLHRRDLPGTPDLVFPSRGKIIFVHGCFWHRHNDPSCRLARLPKSRLDFWIPKFETNLRRDALVAEQLNTLGWDVLIIWECQLRDVPALENKIREFLEHKAPS